MRRAGGSLLTAAALLVSLTVVGSDPADAVDGEGETPSTEVSATAVLAQPDGGLLVGGSFTSYAGSPAPHLVRLVSGVPDQSFAANLGAGFDGEVRGLAAQPDGRILVVGAFTTVAGTVVPGLARLGADGVPDPSLVAPLGLGLSLAPGSRTDLRSVSVALDGRLVVSGSLVAADGSSTSLVVWLGPDGAPEVPPPDGPMPTRFGSSVYTGDGATFAEGLSRANAAYGDLGVVRVFYPGLPAPWPGKETQPSASLVVSFKAPPAAVAAGAYDTFFRAWFADAPRDRDIYWTNFHEPEDNIEEGAFTAADYIWAFRRLAELAAEAGNPRLHATTIWMCYDLRQRSGRDWHDYYPGSDVVDVMAWDCYANRGTRNGVYLAPATLLDDLRSASESMGKPWGLAEYGAQLVTGDEGTGRAVWLTASATYAREHQALWVSYFDSFHRADYRLLDAPSAAAWRWAVSGS